ncbi:hypothetical protein [Actinoplanes sp. G11-F43]
MLVLTVLLLVSVVVAHWSGYSPAEVATLIGAIAVLWGTPVRFLTVRPE